MRIIVQTFGKEFAETCMFWEGLMETSWMVLLAAPYRSGTGDDPVKMRANLDAMEKVALQVWQRGHIPVIGEWLAHPLAAAAGSTRVGDAVWDSLGYSVADRLLEHCDAVLRLSGDSRGAEGDVLVARRRGLPVFTAVEQLPRGEPLPGRN